MVKHMADPKYSEDGLANTDTARLDYDNKLPLPMTKKRVFRDLQIENRITMPKSVESSFFWKENGPVTESTQDFGTGRSGTGHHLKKSQSTGGENGNLVYVRRKPEAEPPKSSIYVGTDNDYCFSPPKKLPKTTEEKLHVKNPSFSISEIAPMTACSLMSFPPGKPSVPSFIGNSPYNLLAMSSDNSISVAPSYCFKRLNDEQWQERYCQLQDVLDGLDDKSNQENYIQMLRSMSSVGLSSHAVGLEKRSIQLSLAEAKELRRFRQLDVLGKYAQNSRTSAAQQS